MDRRSFGKSLAISAMAPAVLRIAAQTPSAAPASKIRFSVMLWTLGRNLPLDSKLATVSAAGYQGVELTNEVTGWAPADAVEARKQIASRGLMVDAMDGGRFTLADPATSTTMVEPFTRRIQLAKALGCPHLILTPGRTIDGVDRATMHATIGDSLRKAGELAAKENMEVLLEPIDLIESKGTASVYSVADAFDIIRSIGHPNVKVLYDFYHEQRSSGNLLEKLDNNIDLIGLVHIADVPGRHQPGTGEINYTSIYRRLSQLNYDRFIAMEFYPTEDPVVDLRSARLGAIKALNSVSA